MKTKVEVVKGIQLTTIENDCGLSVTFSNLGAGIYSINYDGVPMTSYPLDINDFKKPNIYHGKTIGQVSNRIKDGKVVINDKVYQFDLNEEPNTLHGGKQGLSNQIFGNQRMTLQNGDAAVMYSFFKKDKKGTLPGNINYMIMYVVSKDEPKIHVEYRLHTDKDTMVCLTNHCYFCLGEKNIDNLSFMISSNRYVEPNPDDLVPQAEKDIIPCLDFNKKKKLIKDIDNPYLVNSKTKGYDHCFIRTSKNAPIELESDKYLLKVDTDFDCCQIYTDNYEDDIKFSNTLEKARRSVAIEPEDNTFDRKVLTKEVGFYTRYINYKFIKK